MSKWIFGVVLFLVAAVSWAQTRKSDPRLQYVGAITINSANPKALAGWYTEKLGLDASSEYHGLYYVLRLVQYEIRRFQPRNSSHSRGS
jgi:hypothetical protein